MHSHTFAYANEAGRHVLGMAAAPLRQGGVQRGPSRIGMLSSCGGAQKARFAPEATDPLLGRRGVREGAELMWCVMVELKRSRRDCVVAAARAGGPPCRDQRKMALPLGTRVPPPARGSWANHISSPDAVVAALSDRLETTLWGQC